MKLERFEDLECWQQARRLTGLISHLCENQRFAKDGRLKDQLTGAAISVMNNTAEGFGSQSNPEFRRFLVYSRRSVSEVQSSLYVASDRNYVSSEQFRSAYNQSEATRKVIDGLLRYLRSKREGFAQKPSRFAKLNEVKAKRIRRT